MRVYITYFRYDRGESYSIYHIDRNKSSAIKHYKEEDLPHFLGYGPDDVSQLYLVKCDLTKSDYEFLKSCSEDSEISETDVEFYGIMEDINDTWDENDLIYSDTGDTNMEVLDFFIQFYRHKDYLSDVPEDKDELRDQLSEVLFNNEQVYEAVLKNYINLYY